MTWTVLIGLGLARSVRTFTLEDYEGMTQLTVSQRATGPFRGIAWNTLPGTLMALTRYVDAVRVRAELLSRHGSPVHSGGRRRISANRP